MHNAFMMLWPKRLAALTPFKLCWGLELGAKTTSRPNNKRYIDAWEGIEEAATFFKAIME